MKNHRFQNSNPAGSNCTICEGKARDCIHNILVSEYAHQGTSESLSPMTDASRRESALADGLRRLAWKEGITFREPLQMDSNGEFSLAVSNGTARDGKHDVCGKFGGTDRRAIKQKWRRKVRHFSHPFHVARNRMVPVESLCGPVDP